MKALKSKRVLAVLAALALLGAWGVYRARGGRRQVLQALPSMLHVEPGAWSLEPGAWTGTAAHPLDRVIVGLERVSGRPRAVIRASGPARVLDGTTGVQIGALSAGAELSLAVDPVGSRVIARWAPARRGARGASRGGVWERRRAAIRLVPVGETQFRLGRARYAGNLVARVRGAGLAFTNEIDVEEYLAGVVPGEVPNRFALEAQKALAVAARTYALAKRGKHAAEGYDLCDGTHCQMYVGVLPWAPQGKRAVRETRGLLAWYDGEPIHTFYSADCGGRTANNEDLPLSDMPRRPLPYLRALPDGPGPGHPDYCAASPFHQWTRLLSARALEAALNRHDTTRIGILTGLRFIAYDPSGRVRRVRLEGLMWPKSALGAWHLALGWEQVSPDTEGSFRAPGSSGSGQAPSAKRQAPPFVGPPPPIVREVDGWEFRRSVGWRVLRSTLARVRHVAPDRYLFAGRGNGHGVGLCQIGADGMARAPYHRSFREILAHYYPGVQVAPLAQRLGRAAPMAPLAGGGRQVDRHHRKTPRTGERRKPLDSAVRRNSPSVYGMSCRCEGTKPFGVDYGYDAP